MFQNGTLWLRATQPKRQCHGGQQWHKKARPGGSKMDSSGGRVQSIYSLFLKKSQTGLEQKICYHIIHLHWLKILVQLGHSFLTCQSCWQRMLLYVFASGDWKEKIHPLPFFFGFAVWLFCFVIFEFKE